MMTLKSFVLQVSGLYEREAILVETEEPEIKSSQFRLGRTELGEYLDEIEKERGAQVVSVSAVSPTSVLVTVRVP